MKHVINVPTFGKVIVIAPTGSGKTTLIARIEQVLREEFKAQTLSRTLDAERRLGSPQKPAEWEREMVKETVWELEEINLR